MNERIDVKELVQHLREFPNYWELYCFARQVFTKPEDFNTNMRTLRDEYLNLLLPRPATTN